MQRTRLEGSLRRKLGAPQPESVRLEREQLKSVLTAAHIGEWELDLRTLQARTSLKFDQCFGMSQKLSNWNYDLFITYVHPEDRSELDASFERAIAERGEWNFECRVVWADKSIHWLEGYALHYADNANNARFVGIVQDVTLRRARELQLINITAKLAEQKVLTELALVAADTGIWSVDLKTNIAHYDVRCQTLFGFPETLTLDQCIERIHPEDRDAVEEALILALDPAGKGRFTCEYRQQLPDGSYKWLAAAGATTFENQRERKAILLAATVQDIHERKTTELALAGLNEDLERSVFKRTAEVRSLAADLTLTEEKERRALARTLHDTVQQELVAAQYTLGALKNKVEGEALAGVVEAETILKDTLTMTRQITTDLRPVTFDDPDLRASLHWLADVMQRKYGLKVSVVGDLNCDIQDEARRSLLFNLTNELLFNIVKHAGVKSATVSVKKADDIVLTVEDKGQGFDVAQLSASGGTGLGLSGAHKRLRLFGGCLDIDSRLNKGTKVTVRMPTSAASSAGQH